MKKYFHKPRDDRLPITQAVRHDTPDAFLHVLGLIFRQHNYRNHSTSFHICPPYTDSICVDREKSLLSFPIIVIAP